MKIFLIKTLSIVLLCGGFVVSSFAKDISYRVVGEIAIGGEGGWDYLTIDSDARRLYVSHGTKVEVIDLEKEKVIGEIGDTPGIHGIALAPKLGRAFCSNGRENKVSIVDLKTLKTLSKVETGENPDAILFEPSRKEVYAFNGRGKSATVFNAKTGKVIATIPLSGKPEFAVADPKAGKIFCNLEDKSEVAVIDIKTHSVVNRWPIAPGEGASGMAADLAHHRLFIGCSNQKMVMIDCVSGKVISTVPIGDGVDANAFDPETQLAFSSNGDGTLTIAHENSPNELAVVQTLKTQRGCRTMALDSKTHKIYLPTGTYETTSAPASGANHQRPKILPGTFKVVVCEMNGN